MLLLKAKSTDPLAFDPEGLLPERFAEATADDVRNAPLWSDSNQVCVGDLLQVDGDPSDQHWRLEADLSGVDRLGEEMKSGRIEVAGSVGNQAGARMRGGAIIVEGDAGNELGAEMRRGLIAIRGAIGELAGYRMKAGTILALGKSGPRPGAEMTRGTIGLFGESTPLLPTFKYSCDFKPAWLPILANQTGFDLPKQVKLYSGDLVYGGRGEVLTPVTNGD